MVDDAKHSGENDEAGDGSAAKKVRARSLATSMPSPQTLAQIQSAMRASDLARVSSSISSLADIAKTGSAFASLADISAAAKAGAAAAASLSKFGSVSDVGKAVASLADFGAIARAGAVATSIANINAMAKAGSITASLANLGALTRATADATLLARSYSGLAAKAVEAHKTLGTIPRLDVGIGKLAATSIPRLDVGKLAAISSATQLAQTRQLYAATLPKLPAFDLSALNRIATEQQQLRVSMGTLASVHQSFVRQMADLRRLSDRLQDFAALAKGLDSTHPFAQLVEQELPDLDKLKRLEGKADASAARDLLFAIWDGKEALPEQAAIESEIAAIPGFDLLSINAKLDRLLEMADTSQTPRAVEYLVAVALNLVANALGADFSGALWALIGVIILVGYFWPKDRVRRTKKLLRAGHVTDPNNRMVRYACKVFDTPKSKAKQIGWLDAAAIVVVADGFKGWRQIFFLDVEDNETRLGWVRAKYLDPI